MKKVAIVTDSNSGITQKESGKLGIYILPMPFYIDGQLYFEDIDLTQEEFYARLAENADISTSQPAPGDVTDMWDKLLQEYDEIVHIPMSSGLSGSCETAMMLAQDYEDKVYVVNNQRISVTQRQSAIDAKAMADKGMSGKEIKQILEDTKFESSIYIMVDTLKYLKKGGRVTPAAAALGTLLKIKPVLQIRGEKLDAFSKARTIKQAKQIMIDATKHDFVNDFHVSEDGKDMVICGAYSGTDTTEIDKFVAEMHENFPDNEIVVNPLSLSVACHIGPGSIAIACVKKLDILK